MFAIGIDNFKYNQNVGTLMRSAANLGADWIFTIGNPYKRQSSDTVDSAQHLSVKNFTTAYDLAQYCKENDYNIVGIEINDQAKNLISFDHPVNSVYILGKESSGLTKETKLLCDCLVQLDTKYCMNVSCIGSIVMYDRIFKQGMYGGGT